MNFENVFYMLLTLFPYFGATFARRSTMD